MCVVVGYWFGFLIHAWWCLCFFFFFQAEDGIRDIGVTGVQTCALPILAREIMELHTVGIDGGYSQADVTEFARAMTGLSIGGPRGGDGRYGLAVFRERSEERRVGKECRFWGAEDDEKKKRDESLVVSTL